MLFLALKRKTHTTLDVVCQLIFKLNSERAKFTRPVHWKDWM